MELLKRIDYQQNNLTFKALLVSDKSTRKILYNQLSDYYSKITPKNPLNGKQAYKLFQQQFKEMTRGIGGTFKLIKDELLPKLTLLNVNYRSPKGEILEQPATSLSLFPHEILPDLAMNNEPTFNKATVTVIKQIFGVDNIDNANNRFSTLIQNFEAQEREKSAIFSTLTEQS